MEFIDFHTHQPTAEGVISPRSFGIHPWDADKEETRDYDSFRAEYLSRFEQADIVGECGLDKCCVAKWERQKELFEWQIRIAIELDKPMVIHCVRSYDELMAMRRAVEGLMPGTWVVHGFTGHRQLAGQLYREGIWVSYGAAILDSRRIKVRDSLSDNPNPFMLETDTDSCGIEAIYREAACIRGTTPQELANTIKENYNALFEKKDRR